MFRQYLSLPMHSLPPRFALRLFRAFGSWRTQPCLVPATSGDHGLRDDILDQLHHSFLRFRLGSPCQRLPRDNRADVEYRMG